MQAAHGNPGARAATFAVVGVVALGAIVALSSCSSGVGVPSPSPIKTILPGSLVWVSGTVTTASGSPASGTILAYRDSVEPFGDDPQGSDTLDAQGGWRLTLQAGDRYCLVVATESQTTPRPWGETDTTLFFGPSRWSMRSAERECFAPTSALMLIDFVLPEGTPVSGTLTWIDGTPLGSTAQRQVHLMASVGDANVSAVTSVDENGRFAMRLPPDTFSFSEVLFEGEHSRSDDGLGTTRVGTRAVTGLHLMVDGVPPAFTSLVGRVVDAAGTALPATITAYPPGAQTDYPEAVAWTDANGRWDMIVQAGRDYCLSAAPGEGRTLQPAPLPGYPKRVFFWPSGSTTEQRDAYCIATSGRSEVEINLTLTRA